MNKLTSESKALRSLNISKSLHYATLANQRINLVLIILEILNATVSLQEALHQIKTKRLAGLASTRTSKEKGEIASYLTEEKRVL